MSDSSGGDFPSLWTLLFVLFVGLKLTGHIAWSWWWITSPLWGAILLGAFLILLFKREE